MITTVRLEGVNGYTFSGESLAWAAQRVAAGDASGAGALGPVEAFGLDRLRGWRRRMRRRDRHSTVTTSLLSPSQASVLRAFA